VNDIYTLFHILRQYKAEVTFMQWQTWWKPTVTFLMHSDLCVGFVS